VAHRKCMMEDRKLGKWRMGERIALETEDDKPTKKCTRKY